MTTNDPRDDLALIKAFLRGQDEAFEALAKRYLAPVYRFIYRLTGEAGWAEDLVQETFVKVWKNLARYDQRKSFKVWLFTIARHTSFDWLKKKDPLKYSARLADEAPEDETALELEDGRPLAPDVLDLEQRRAELERALDNISLKSRSVVLLHDFEDLTFQEISENLAEPVNTVKSRYRRALRNLRDLLHPNP